MGRLIIFVLVSVFFFSGYCQTNDQQAILDKFITYHNDGTEKALNQFIRETYNPVLYDKVDLKKQTAFYDQIVKEFGRLNEHIYKVESETSLKLIVHLIKESETILNRNIDPREILVVEIDVSDNNSKYLSRGLGLGALVCEIRKKE
jgi:hypothetical protein